MIGRVIDKLVFGAALLIALQLPLFSEHYHQFLSGFYEATKVQVERYEQIAKMHEYKSVSAMIEHHLQNSVASVRSDAQMKLVTLNDYKALEKGISVFENGNFVEKIIYMFSPDRTSALMKTWGNFEPGVPLSVEGFSFGVIMALLINYLVTMPFCLVFRRFKSGRGNA